MRPKKIYIAGASKEPERVAHWMKRIRGEGYEVTHDWLELVTAAVVPDHDLTRGARAMHAVADFAGVFHASYFWLLAPPSTSTSAGAWVELGYVLGLNRALRGHPMAQTTYVVSSGPGSARSIFTALADREFPEDQEAFAFFARQQP